MAQNPRIFFVDAYALIYRSYYAFLRSPMFNAEGLNTSVLYGFLSALEDIRTKEKPTHLAVAFDTSAPTFRHRMYEPYKANREETPEDIRQSVPLLKDILRAYRIPILECEGYEADDIIGTLARQAAEKSFNVFMVTPDKDFVQLVDSRVFLYKPSRSGRGADILGVPEVCAQYGLETPAQFVDILALMGDASDNIPGAAGIGEKGAMKLISEFQSVDNLLAQVDKLKGSIKEKVENSRDRILLSRELARICTQVPVVFDEQDCRVSEPDRARLREWFVRLGFRSFLSRLDSQSSSRWAGVLSQSATDAPPLSSGAPSLFDAQPPSSGASALFDVSPVNSGEDARQGVLDFDALFGATAGPTPPASGEPDTLQTTPHEYLVADAPESRRVLLETLRQASLFAFDTETTSLDTFRASLVGMSFAVEPFRAWYVPVPGDPGLAAGVVAEFRDVFANPEIGKVGQNMKFDLLMLQRYGIEVAGALFDTMLAHYLIQPEQRHNLDALAEHYLHYKPVPIEQLIGNKGKGQRSMRDVPVEEIAAYAAEDADVALRLSIPLRQELDRYGMLPLAQEVEMPLSRVLAGMETAGVRIDIPAMEAAGKGLAEELAQLEQDIYDLAGEPFNVSSPRQLGEVLFERMKIAPPGKKTKTRQYATGEEVLLALSDKHPIVNKVLEYRALKKLLSTYIEALPKLVLPATGRIHTSFNQAVTATGRLSSTDPNLQNIPIRDARGREIRRAFVSAGPEYVLLSADYSQVELRLMAHISGDENMIQAFMGSEDIHAATAARIFGVSRQEVTREMRSRAKTANFGIIYGISGFGLAQRLGIPRGEAQDLIAGYFRAYPEVRRYMNEIILKAREQGYVETIMGRRRYLPDIRSTNAVVRGMAERNAINAPVQGSAADLIKVAMVRIDHEIRSRGLRSRLILQVHDELVLDVFMPELEQVRALVRRNMEQAAQLRVPLVVDIGEGPDWFEAH